MTTTSQCGFDFCHGSCRTNSRNFTPSTCCRPASKLASTYQVVPEYGLPEGIDGMYQVPNGRIAVGGKARPTLWPISYTARRNSRTAATTISASFVSTPCDHMIDTGFIRLPGIGSTDLTT